MAAPHYWVLPPVAPDAGVTLPLAQVSALLHRLGRPGRHAVAEELLRLAGSLVPLAQCTIFAYQGQGRPRIVAVGDRSRTQALPRISQDYVSRFYPLDGSVRVMQAELAAAQRAAAAHPRILLHRQRGEDVSHPDYRAICYELPQVAERLAILALYAGRRWLSVNFYRGLEHGPFDDAAIATLEALAPLVVDVVRLHYAGQAVQHDLGELMLDRLQRRCPALTVRDLDVLRALLAGQPTEQLAQQLGLTLSSAQTYLKRVYRKLGIAGQRELLGLLTEPDAVAGSPAAAG